MAYLSWIMAPKHISSYFPEPVSVTWLGKLHFRLMNLRTWRWGVHPRQISQMLSQIFSQEQGRRTHPEKTTQTHSTESCEGAGFEDQSAVAASWGMTTAARGWRRWGIILLQDLQGRPSPANTLVLPQQYWLWILTFRSVKEYVSLFLSHQVCGPMEHKPQK